MKLFIAIMLIVLTISNVFLWIVCKGYMIMIHSLYEKIVALGDFKGKEGENHDERTAAIFD